MFDIGGMNVTQTGSSGNGFISSLGDAWDKTLDKVSTEVLPNWIDSVIREQTGTQLDSPTYDQQAGKPRQDMIQDTTLDKPMEGGLLQQAGSFIGSINMGSGTVLAAGVVLLGAFVALKLYKSI